MIPMWLTFSQPFCPQEMEDSEFQRQKQGLASILEEVHRAAQGPTLGIQEGWKDG